MANSALIAKPKLSYKNVLLTPATKIVSVPSPQLLQTSLALELLNTVHDDIEQAFSYAPIQFIVEEEEKELTALGDPTSASYKQLYSTLSEVGKLFRVNMMAVIGHVEICVDYMKSVDFEDRPHNNYANIILVIGCHSTEYLNQFRANPLYQANQNFFFGFKNLVHVIDGEIYMCKDSQTEQPFLDCRYKGSLEDQVALWDQKAHAYKTDELMKENSQNKLVQCIHAREHRYIKTYKEGIWKRVSVKFRAEDIAKKISSLLSFVQSNKNTNGSFNHSKLTDDILTFQFADGLACTATTCPMKLEKKWDAINEQFDKETRYIKTVNNILEALKGAFTNPKYNASKTDSQVSSYLSALPIEEANLALNANTGGWSRSPLWFLPFTNQHLLPITIKEIFTKYSPDYTLMDDFGNGFMHVFINRLRREKIISKEIFRIFLRLLDVPNSRDLFLTYDSDGLIPFIYFFDDLHLFLPLVYFYFKFFPGITSKKQITMDYNEASKKTEYPILYHLFKNDMKSSECLIVLEMLLVYGVDPNALFLKNERSVEYYENNLKNSLMNPSVIQLMYTYGYEDNGYAKKRLDYYSTLQNDPKKQEEYEQTLLKEIMDLVAMRMNIQRRMYRKHKYNYSNNNNSNDERASVEISRLQKKLELAQYRSKNLKAFLDAAVRSFQIAQDIVDGKVQPVKKTPDEIEKEIDYFLAPYIEGNKAIPVIKDLFTTIQKYVKKSKANATAKKAFLDKVTTIYQSKASNNENLGNSALRRLEPIQKEFNTFKQTYPATGGGKQTRKRRYRNKKTRKH